MLLTHCDFDSTNWSHCLKYTNNWKQSYILKVKLLWGLFGAEHRATAHNALADNRAEVSHFKLTFLFFLDLDWSQVFQMPSKD